MKVMLSGLAASVGVVLPDRSIPYWLADTIAGGSGGVLGRLPLPGDPPPPWLADTIAAVSEDVWRLLRLSGDPPLTGHAAVVMARDCILIGTKAEKELGY